MSLLLHLHQRLGYHRYILLLSTPSLSKKPEENKQNEENEENEENDRVTVSLHIIMTTYNYSTWDLRVIESD